MKILALESSATAASVALCEDETLLAQAFLHTGLTHSQTLLPMARDLLKACGLTPAQVDLIAVAAGPGSFTGLRIGVATAKGLAWAAEKPCAGCSTLASMAWNLAGFSGQVCVAMDARRHQIYNARFQVDGTQLCYDALTAAGIPAKLAPPNLRLQSAWGVAREGLALAQAGQTYPPDQLVPAYHRLSQAERERLAREKAAPAPQNQ